MTAVAALIAKLEAATEADERTIIQSALDHAVNHRWISERDYHRASGWLESGASLDAALTLVESGSEYSISTLFGLATVEVGLNHTDGPVRERRSDGNVCLALCIAALRARQA